MHDGQGYNTYVGSRNDFDADSQFTGGGQYDELGAGDWCNRSQASQHTIPAGSIRIGDKGSHIGQASYDGYTSAPPKAAGGQFWTFSVRTQQDRVRIRIGSGMPAVRRPHRTPRVREPLPRSRMRWLWMRGSGACRRVMSCSRGWAVSRGQRRRTSRTTRADGSPEERCSACALYFAESAGSIKG